MKSVYILTLALPLLVSLFLCTGPGGKHWRSVTCLAAAAELLLTVITAAGARETLVLFSVAGLSFTLAPDTLGCIFAIMFSALFFAAALFATEYMEHDSRPGQFCIVFLLTLDALLGLAMAADLPAYYMFFECLTLAAFPLILHDREEQSVKAARKFLCYSLMGAALVLFGMVYASRLLGSLSFLPGGRGVSSENAGTALAVAFVTITGFGCKAGLMPLHAWLPAAHPRAPAPASAVMSGCLTKAGVLGIIRTVYYLYGAGLLRGTWVQHTLIAVSLVTVFCGSMLAYKEKILKKRLAYSTVSQVSYALFGLFLMNEAGFAGAMLQVLFHGITKVCLFICAGAVIHRSGMERIYSSEGEFQYYGLGRLMPLTMTGYTLAALSLVGLPPFGGFVSKWYLAEGSFAALGFSGWIGAAVLLASALLTAGYLLSITANAFFPPPGRTPVKASEASWRTTAPVIVLSVLLAVLGIYSFGYAGTVMSLAGALM